MNKKLRRLLGRRKSNNIEEKNKRNKKALSSLLCERNNAEPNQYLSGQKNGDQYGKDVKEKLDVFITADPSKDDSDILKPGDDDSTKPGKNWQKLTVELEVQNSENVNKETRRETDALLGNVAPSIGTKRAQEILLYNQVPEAQNKCVVSSQPCGIWPVTQHLISTTIEHDSIQKADRPAQTSNKEVFKKDNTYTNGEMTSNLGLHAERNGFLPMDTSQDNNLKRSIKDHDAGWLSMSESQNQEVNNNNKMMILDPEMNSATERCCHGCPKRRPQRVRHRHPRHCGSCHHHGNHHRKLYRCAAHDHAACCRQHACTPPPSDTNCCGEARHSCAACSVHSQPPEVANKRYSSAVLFTITDDNVALSSPRVVEFSHARPIRPLNLQRSHGPDPEDSERLHGGRAFNRHPGHVVRDDAVHDCHEDFCHFCGNNDQFCNPASSHLQQHNCTASIKLRNSIPSTSGLNQTEKHSPTHPDNMPPALSIDRSCHQGCWCNDSLTHNPEILPSGFFPDSCASYPFEDNFLRQPRDLTPEAITRQSLAHFSLSKRAYARLISYCHTKKLLTDVYPEPVDIETESLRSMHHSSHAGFRCATSEHLRGNQFTLDGHRVRSVDSSAMELCRLGKVFETVEECPWYWGPLSGQDAKKMLRGTAPGTFLLRDSSDSRFLFSLSLKTEQGPTSIRIVYKNGLFRFDSESDDVNIRKRHTKASSKSNDKRRQCVVRMILHYTYHLSKSLESLSISDSESVSSSRDSVTNVSSTASGGNGARSQFMCFWVDQGGRKEIPVGLLHPLSTGCKSLEHLARSRISKHYRLWNNTHLINQLQLPEMLKNSLRKYPYPI